MIDLTPLDVRSKRGDFKKLMRGYDPQEVDTFLELVAERLEELTRENIGLRERAQTLQQQVASQTDREQAVQEALVTAQELRADIRGQAQREAESILKEAETEGRRLVAEAEAEARTKLRSSERRLDHIQDALQEMERRRTRFLKEFRQLLEREMDVVEVEEERKPLEDRAIDLELGAKRAREKPEAPAKEPEAAADEAQDREVEVQEDAEFRPLDIPMVEDVPHPDVPVDELAAAYERERVGEEGSQAAPESGVAPKKQSELEDALDHAPPAPKGQKHDNLMLYLDTDDDA
ncbi:MAG: DivIVA domain-containing protein [Gemmatimonadota bacterium]|jgi:DivIVA domain-containing protein